MKSRTAAPVGAVTRATRSGQAGEGTLAALIEIPPGRQLALEFLQRRGQQALPRFLSQFHNELMAPARP